MKIKNFVRILSVLLVVMVCGCGNQRATGEEQHVLISESEKEKGQEVTMGMELDQKKTRTFGDWSLYDEFQNVPRIEVEESRIGQAQDYGGGTYLIEIRESTWEDYKNYLQLLGDSDFTLFADNGVDGLDGTVYTSTFTKADLVLTVTYLANPEKICVTACFDQPLSGRMLCAGEELTDKNKKEQVRLHMLEIFSYGSSFIVELKNGHFILMDGGFPEEAPYLLDYLETLVAEGEVPVIEAWFFSHAHPDHTGILQEILTNEKLLNRIYVEEIYFNEPAEEIAKEEGSAGVRNIKAASKILRKKDGGTPALYRPQTGQRYYFDDLVVEVVLTQEQVPESEYQNLFNETSTWLMLTIEGQKCLFGADSGQGGMKKVMSIYNKEYLEVDIFQALHHGINTYDPFTDYCTVKTVLIPRNILVDNEANRHLSERAEECMSYRDGTKILAFPYTVGESVSLQNREWIYHSLMDILRKQKESEQ